MAHRGYSRAAAVALAAVRATATKRTTRHRRVEPGQVSPIRPVPDHIPRPPYMAGGKPANPLPAHEFMYDPDKLGNIEVKTPHQIEKMRAACRLARETLEVAGSVVAPGSTTERIDAAVHDFVCSRGAYPSPLGYMGFPKSCCTSVNDVLGHGIPDDRLLQDGDILNVDITVYLDGYHGDTSCMFFVGTPSKESVVLCEATRKAMEAGIRVCGPGQDFREIGKAVGQVIESHGCRTSTTLCGHGIGKYFHGAPMVIPVENDSDQGLMRPGMTFTVEPVLIEKAKDEWAMREDGWTMQTVSGAWTAQFEHTVLITETGHEVLTGPTINYIALCKRKQEAAKQRMKRQRQAKKGQVKKR